jgi:cation diffusion facilitator CzcD-associated flavoprotein CzcO
MLQAGSGSNGRPPARDLEVIIIGAGFGGIAAAIELRRHGIRSVRILEKASDLGGTWLYNSYPGSACDVPSHLYSFSFAQRKDWSRLCSPQAEIHSYLHDVARDHGIEPLIRADTSVKSCTWDEQRCRWSVRDSDGNTYECDAIVVATGQLDQPSIPSLPGAESFAGHAFHSAEWDHDYDLRDKRVAVVGSGASAVQFVPEIAPQVGRLSVFQRTGNWFLPRKNLHYPGWVKAAFERVPGLQAWRRLFVFYYTESLTLCIRHPRTLGRLMAARSAAFMRSQLPDGEVRRKAWPGYTFGCKRILFSSAFLPALQLPQVELVTEAIESIEPAGLRTADGRLREFDCVIWATGFKTNDFMFPMEITGTGGRSLSDSWAAGPRAHLGITVPGFPNMFLMYGPNTNTSGGSIIVYLEAQARYLRQALQRVRARGAGAIEVRREVEAASDRSVQERFAGTAWLDCQSWYRDEGGRIVANWPGYMREYLELTDSLDEAQFTFSPLPERVAA